MIIDMGDKSLPREDEDACSREVLQIPQVTSVSGIFIFNAGIDKVKQDENCCKLSTL